jgi:hypothetical protein
MLLLPDISTPGEFLFLARTDKIANPKQTTAKSKLFQNLPPPHFHPSKPPPSLPPSLPFISLHLPCKIPKSLLNKKKWGSKTSPRKPILLAKEEK